jgi:hypothetical protein
MYDNTAKNLGLPRGKGRNELKYLRDKLHTSPQYRRMSKAGRSNRKEVLLQTKCPLPDPVPQSLLCHGCQAIPWSTILQYQRHFHNTAFHGLVPIFHASRSPNSSLRSMSHLATNTAFQASDCELCELFRTLDLYHDSIDLGSANRLFFDPHITIDTQSSMRQMDLIRRPSAPTLSSDNGRSSFRKTIGIIHPEGRYEKFKPRLIKPDSIDYNIVRQWLWRCTTERCSDTSDSSKTCVPMRGENVFGFKLIDCRTREVVVAPEDCSYVALSYVWGQNQAGWQGDGFPPTIDDSIVVTLELGFKYLCKCNGRPQSAR